MNSMPKYESYKDSGVAWLGNIPTEWDLISNKHIFNLKKNLVGKRSSEYELLSLTLKGIIKRDMENPEGKFPAEFDTYQEVKVDDFVFCLFDVEETPRTVGLSPYEGMITGAYTVFDVMPEYVPRFLYYFYLNLDASKRLKPLYKGLRNTIPKDAFLSFKTFVPAKEMQAAIADFLDQKTAQLDEAIAIKEQQIALLKERKQIIIQQAVTQGLDPNVPMKDSGVDWIGQIPEHWEVTKVKFASSFITSGPRGWSDFFTDKGAVFLQSGDLDESMGISFEKAVRVKPPVNTEGVRTKLQDNDVLVCITGAKTGKVSLAVLNDQEVYINQHLCLIRSLPTIVPRFLALALHSGIGKTYFYLQQYGLKEGLGLADVKNALVTLPPLNEQNNIVNFVETEIKKYSEIIELNLLHIERLKEYKSTLINSAVTGKIKVA